MQATQVLRHLGTHVCDDQVSISNHLHFHQCRICWNMVGENVAKLFAALHLTFIDGLPVHILDAQHNLLSTKRFLCNTLLPPPGGYDMGKILNATIHLINTEIKTPAYTTSPSMIFHSNSCVSSLSVSKRRSRLAISNQSFIP